VSGDSRQWIWIAVVVVLVLALGSILLGRRPATREGGLPAEVSVVQAATMQGGGSFLLDVRQPEEWNESHIGGTTLIPLGELKARVAEVPRDREIVVLCRSGRRSQSGRDILLEAGFERVTSMTGGINAWKAEGRPTVAGP
jgi:rhodanese-related sulfurtransferase